MTLFELSKYLSDETIENHAFDLFQESLTYEIAVCNSTRFNHVDAYKILHLIEEAQDMLNKRDIVCNSPSFSIQMYKYGVLHNNDKFQEEGRDMLEICMNNTVIPALKFRQKTNLILSLNELYTLDSSMDYRNMSNKIFDTLVSDDIRSLEQIIYNQILKVSPFGIGVYEGVSRLALLLIYHEQLTTGVYPKHLFGLLN